MNVSKIDTHPPSGPSPRPQIFVLLSIPLPVENPVPNPPQSLVLLAQLAALDVGIVDEDDAVVDLLEDVVQGEAVGRELPLPDSLSDALESPFYLCVLNAVRRGLCDGTR